MAALSDISVGKVGFVEQHGLWTDQQREAAERIVAEVEQRQLKTIRVAWGDQHGVVRGKNIMAHDFLVALRNGIDFQTATVFFDTSNNMIAPMFSSTGGLGVTELAGGPDAILVPDPSTFRILPWANKTGWVLSDMHLNDGRPMPFDSRRVLRKALDELAATGNEYVAGLEVEFYITKLEDPALRPEECNWPSDPPKVSAIAHGFQYLTEHRNDEIDPILEVLRDNLVELGLPLRTIEDEWGPGQCEFTFDPCVGLEAADNMLLLRSAIKQICRRRGLHATFMTRPGLPNFFASGWHLHQSFRSSSDGTNTFTNRADDGQPLSEMARHFVGGLLEHAAPASVFSTPTINGYKRFRPYSFAPDKVTWGLENRAAFIRVLGEPGDETAHVENRAGEPCANPYLYMASQIVCGLDGISNRRDPGPPQESPYESDSPKLPASLMDAVATLQDSALFRKEFGDPFVDYMVALKQSEIGRFLTTVTDWEHREYFEIF
jgi:glutamine synthetase